MRKIIDHEINAIKKVLAALSELKDFHAANRVLGYVNRRVLAELDKSYSASDVLISGISKEVKTEGTL